MNLRRPCRKLVYRQKINILLVQITNRNMGDTVIADNAAYLVRQAIPRLLRQHCVLQPYDISSEDFERVRAADLIVFAGGGLVKFRQENFHNFVPGLLECARAYDIPVYFNSVGVEGYDAEDERCKRLAQTLNYDCVKVMTVRDDLETLRRDYLHNRQIFTKAAIDTAVYTPDVYGIRKDAQSVVIGLGIVRWRIFEDYGRAEITREFQLEMWKGIIKELEARGYQWNMFVNGLKADYDFAVEVLEYIGRVSDAEYLLIQRPLDGRELAGTIASFAGVIACRMHANIIAYALGIPSIGLVWNDKMIFWGERIGCPERFLSSEQFQPKQIVQCMLRAISEGVKPCSNTWKKNLQVPLRKFIHKYAVLAWQQKCRRYLPKPRSWSSKLVATALGGMNLRYTSMNASKNLEASLQNGFQNLEADLRLTTDGRLVCVNGWAKGSYVRLGLEPEQYDSGGIDYQTFRNCRLYDGHYATMDAAQLLERMRQQTGNWQLILDIGKPNKVVLAEMLVQLQELCALDIDADTNINIGINANTDTNTIINANANINTNVNSDAYWKKHLFIRLQSKYDVEAVRKANLPLQIMYYVPSETERDKKKLTLGAIVQYCKKQGIAWVSMPKEALTEDVMACLKKEKLRTCVFSYDTYTEALQALELGVDWIATSHLSPEGLDAWTETAYTIVFPARK